MEIIVTQLTVEYINTIITILENSTPGKRKWIKSDKYSNGYDYNLTERSTFPWWIKFAYVKRPSNWYCLTEEEKKLERLYYQYNTKDIIRILNKIINTKKLTEIQGHFVEELFNNFRQYELDHFEQYNEEIIRDLYKCPF